MMLRNLLSNSNDLMFGKNKTIIFFWANHSAYTTCTLVLKKINYVICVGQINLNLTYSLQPLKVTFLTFRYLI